ncbi:hypothetical protein HPULCUR_006031 [Helicostylum pulchrum]|uniref:Uncharacterized protein n=1 Tax=Helicostylum pulchrum TaxID=562976 RepID=A0ABP9Y0R2_9FUNG
MVKNLRVKDLCEKVYVPPVCAADSPLLQRGLVPTSSGMAITEKITAQVWRLARSNNVRSNHKLVDPLGGS